MASNLGTTSTAILTVRDLRKTSRQAKHQLLLDQEALDIACAVVGVDLCAGQPVLIELRDGDGKKQGYARPTSRGGFKVVVYVAKKDAYQDRHLYVVNNSLLHELRHVAQMQTDPNHGARYAWAQGHFGYNANPYEVDARYFGRVADHTGTKNTGNAGPALGELVWAVRFA